MTFAETAHKIANIVAMLTHHDSRLKMPRPAAYVGYELSHLHYDLRREPCSGSIEQRGLLKRTPMNCGLRPGAARGGDADRSPPATMLACLEADLRHRWLLGRTRASGQVPAPSRASLSPAVVHLVACKARVDVGDRCHCVGRQGRQVGCAHVLVHLCWSSTAWDCARDGFIHQDPA